MKIAVISDTHDNLPRIERAFDELKQHKVDLICHLGDWVSFFTFKLINDLSQKIHVPIIGVLGNNDHESSKHKTDDNTHRQWNIKIEKHTHSFTTDDTDIVLYHGTDDRITEALVKSGQYNLVLTGHTHHSQHEIIAKVHHINPGTLAAYNHQKEGTLAIFDTNTHQVEFIKF